MSDSLLQQVESKMDELILICTRLEKENSDLRSQRDKWSEEKARLVEKNALARKRVEAMISQLKSLGMES